MSAVTVEQIGSDFPGRLIGALLVADTPNVIEAKFTGATPTAKRASKVKRA